MSHYYVEDDQDAPETISPDADLENADWAKQSWDLPPYMSQEFIDTIGGWENLEQFKQTPTYQHAVNAGLILDDEWVGDHVHRIIPKE